MRPWERRLKDLSTLLENCHRTYMEPDLFRMNTNQFLQTARTVTFIIQKNKAEIPNFETWYKTSVVDAWKSDEVMTWAKDARNVIEKEGDLELHSSLLLTLLFSYLEEQDVLLPTGRAELVSAGVKKLIRLAQKSLPSGVGDAAVVKIERKWVASSLPTWELLQALIYVYGRLYECCASLVRHLGAVLPIEISSASQYARLTIHSQGTKFIKLSNLKMHSHHLEVIKKDPAFRPPDSIADFFADKERSADKPSNIETTFQYMSSMAELTFSHYGNHVPMLFLFDRDWHLVDAVSAHFDDQADKYLFWRQAADRVKTQKVHGVSWTSESWIRSAKDYISVPIRKLPIIGERLHTVVFDRDGNRLQAVWDIKREDQESKPRLVRLTDVSELDDATPYYLVPLTRAMGLPDPKLR